MSRARRRKYRKAAERLAELVPEARIAIAAADARTCELERVIMISPPSTF
ncbi:hypothetical protein KCP71_21480 [Salmonella enterica subsp. enterica]|nr:hypothetical protein KCP71_21480 [Salmonella enterica subsp. enterica]